MRWTPGNRGNIEDMRGRSGGGHAVPAAGHRRPAAGALSQLGHRRGLPVAARRRRRDRSAVETSAPAASRRTTPAEEEAGRMVDAVMDDAQKTWRQLLGGRYQERARVLFRDAIQSACGFAQAATGPFYCPAISKVYLDLGFFNELQHRFGAPGRFRAGVRARARSRTSRADDDRHRRAGPAPAAGDDPISANELSVRHGTAGGLLRRRLGPPRQAAAVARPQGGSSSTRGHRGRPERRRRHRRRPHPAHAGRPRRARNVHARHRREQRVKWFRRGFESGDPNACNTFGLSA